jgi:rubredoxin-NAD+ reductase
LAAVGVTWQLQCTVQKVIRTGNGFRLWLSDGSDVTADLVVSAVGLRPDTELAVAAGLACDRGVLTDRELRTSDPDIYALGDCVQAGGFTLPYVMPLNLQAKALARTLTGEATRLEYPPMPVLVKTTLHPVVVAAPPPGVKGDWQEEVTADGVRALFRDAAGVLRGMALTGAFTSERQRWLPELQPLPLAD